MAFNEAKYKVEIIEWDGSYPAPEISTLLSAGRLRMEKNDSFWGLKNKKPRIHYEFVVLPA